MNLVDQIRAIAKLERINKSELILEEAEYFLREHKDHGSYSIELGYNNGRLRAIYLECTADNIIDVNECSHINPKTRAEFSYSVIYYRGRKPSEIKMQKDRREGKITKIRTN